MMAASGSGRGVRGLDRRVFRRRAGGAAGRRRRPPASPRHDRRTSAIAGALRAGRRGDRQFRLIGRGTTRAARRVRCRIGAPVGASSADLRPRPWRRCGAPAGRAAYAASPPRAAGRRRRSRDGRAGWRSAACADRRAAAPDGGGVGAQARLEPLDRGQQHLGVGIAVAPGIFGQEGAAARARRQRGAERLIARPRCGASGGLIASANGSFAMCNP